ncbi:MAG: hypothetical protein RLZZ577_1355 [Bacteroidota bacterium]|jgi:putative intracellular protease/amidase
MKTILNSTLILCTILTSGFSFSQKTNPDSLAIGTADEHQEMMDILFAKPKYPIKKIGILLYDGYNTLDAMGPYHTLAEIMGAKTYFVAKNRGMVKNQRGLEIKIDSSFADVKSLDILVIPGGAAETIMLTKDEETLNWIRTIDKTTKYTTSVCTGAWVLGATGLLKGKNTTSNWYRGEEMMKSYGANLRKNAMSMMENIGRLLEYLQELICLWLSLTIYWVENIQKRSCWI